MHGTVQWTAANAENVKSLWRKATLSCFLGVQLRKTPKTTTTLKNNQIIKCLWLMCQQTISSFTADAEQHECPSGVCEVFFFATEWMQIHSFSSFVFVELLLTKTSSFEVLREKKNVQKTPNNIKLKLTRLVTLIGKKGRQSQRQRWIEMELGKAERL